MQSRPNFLVIGAPKCGTTTLYFRLSSHPQVFMPAALKEPHFFTFTGAQLPNGPGDLNPPKINEWESYLKLFEPVRGEVAIGEASTSYLQVPRAAANIKRYLGGDVKLIATLRNPVDRAYSAYLHKRRNGYETFRDFGLALDAGPERVRAGWHPVWDYLALGFYADHIERVQSIFGEANLKVCLLEDVATNPTNTLKEILSFLGVERREVADANRRHNRGGVPRLTNLHRWLATPPKIVRAPARALLPARTRSRISETIATANLRPPPPLEQDVREHLVAVYAADIAKLERLLDRDLSAWLDVSPPVPTG